MTLTMDIAENTLYVYSFSALCIRSYDLQQHRATQKKNILFTFFILEKIYNSKKEKKTVRTSLDGNINACIIRFNDIDVKKTE